MSADGGDAKWKAVCTPLLAVSPISFNVDVLKEQMVMMWLIVSILVVTTSYLIGGNEILYHHGTTALTKRLLNATERRI